MTKQKQPAPKNGAGEPRSRRAPIRWALGLGILAVVIVGTAVVWNWDWFIPLVEPRVLAAIGRKATIAHLHVHLGRRTKLVADGVQIANPDGFPSAEPFVQVARLCARRQTRKRRNDIMRPVLQPVFNRNRVKATMPCRGCEPL